MIDINSWPPIIVIPFALLPFVITFSGIVMEVWMARSCDFDLIIASQPNSVWLQQQVLFWGTTRLKSRCFVLSTFSGAVLYPKLCIRLGMVDAEDLRNFPPRLRRRLLISSWLIIIGCVWFAIFLALIKLSPTR